jgi:hypothetical protein
MRVKRLIAGLMLAIGFTVVALAGCGGGGSSSTSSGSATSPEAGSPVSASFTTPGGDNTIPTFGKEASAAEREAVSAILEKNLKARASGDWAGQCSTLTKGVIKTLETDTAPLKRGKGCVTRLKAAASVAEARAGLHPEKAAAEAEGRKGSKGPATIRTYTMTGPIDAFRVSGNKGYALYHGIDGLDFSMLMEKEGGEWKVASLVTAEPGAPARGIPRAGLSNEKGRPLGRPFRVPAPARELLPGSSPWACRDG